MEIGRVLEVSSRVGGNQVTANTPVGATILPVADVESFDEDGGTIMLDGLLYTYSSFDGDDSEDNETGWWLNLSTPLTVAVTTDDVAYAYPLAEEKWATVELDLEDDAITVRIDHSLQDMFEEGIRDGEEEQENVEMEMRDEEWVAVSIIAKTPSVNGNYIRPGTIEPPVIAPEETPTPVVTGGIGRFYIEMPELQDATSSNVEVHISTDPLLVPLFGNPATLAKTFNGTFSSVETMPDGTAFTPGAVYYFGIIAYNNGGVATASPVVSATLKTVSTEDISANAAWVGTMSVDRLTGGDLFADTVVAGSGGITARGATGESVGLKGSGFQVKGSNVLGNPVYIDFPTTGAPNIISSILKASTLEVEGSPGGKALSLFGESELAASAVFRLASAVASPTTAPVAVSDYPDNTIDWNGQPQPSSNSTIRGGTFADGFMYFFDSSPTSNRVYWMNPETAQVQGSANIRPLLVNAGNYEGAPYIQGMVKIGANWHVMYLGSQPGQGLDLMVARLNGTFTATVAGSWNPEFGSVEQIQNSQIGTDGTNVVIACRAFAIYTLNVCKYDPMAVPTNGAGAAYRVGNPVEIPLSRADWTNAGPLLGFIAQPVDLNPFRWIFVQRDRVMVWNSVNPTRITSEEWETPGSMSGMGWDGTRFWAMAGNVVYKHSTRKTQSAAWFANAKFNPAVAPALTQTSLASPATKVTIGARQFARVTTSFIGAQQSILYASQSSLYPSRTQLFYVDQNSNGTFLVETLPTQGNNPVAASTFPSNAPAMFISTDGGSYWKGDNSAKFRQLIIDTVAGSDVTTLAGNKPPLRIGDIAGLHMRIDGNEVVVMDNDNTQGRLIINANGPVNISGMVKTGVKASGNINADTDKEISVQFDTAFPTSGPVPVVTVTPQVSSLGSNPMASAVGVTRTGFTLVVRRGTTSPFDTMWTAIATNPS
jgi:hypothetical protein